MFFPKECVCKTCGIRYPIIDEVPVLINDSNSLFTLHSFVDRIPTTVRRRSRFVQLIASLVPSTGINIKAQENYSNLVRLLRQSGVARNVLILGGSIVGKGIQPLLEADDMTFAVTDVSLGDNVTVVCDAHDIPWADGTFDAVVVQAVLEHVLEPYRCVAEIYRVLKDDGLVYSETPFIQQVHGGKYDFTRFTFLGHRRLFRNFSEVDSGVVCGPGMALAWSLQYFFLSFCTSKVMWRITYALTSVVFFWIKYVDYYLLSKPGSLDAASGYYFLGRKSKVTLQDKELIELYSGMV